MKILVGKYLEDLSLAARAAAAARVHLIVLSPPGWGKSSFLRSFAYHVLPPSLVITCDPTTPPSKARGRPHAGALLEGREVMNLDGTLLDPSLKSAVVDEIFRASDPLWDALLPVLERPLPVVLATANWVAKGDRVEALKDRIALWVWLFPVLTSDEAAHIAATALQGSSDGDEASLIGADFSFPGWPEREAIREVWKMTPGPRTVRAVSEMVRSLVDEARQEGFEVNPRRVAQWARIVYFLSALELGQADFDSPTTEAQRALVFAYPADSREVATSWKQVALRVVDRVLAVIEATLAEIKARLSELASAPPTERAGMAVTVSAFLAEKENLLKNLHDPRAEEILHAMDSWFRQAIMGRNPWEGQ